MIEEFVWVSELTRKTIFLDKRDMYINLHRLDSVASIQSCFVSVKLAPYTCNFIGTLRFRFWCSRYRPNVRCPSTSTERMLMYEARFNRYPVQDFCVFVE